MKYGYLPPSDPSTGQLQAWTAVTNAVRAMQRFAGLRDTGVVGEDNMRDVRLLLHLVWVCVILWLCGAFRWRHSGTDEQPTLLPTWPGGTIAGPATAEEEEEEECSLHVDTSEH